MPDLINSSNDVTYSSPNGSTLTFQDDQWQQLVDTYGEEWVDNMMKQMTNSSRAGGSTGDTALLDYAKSLGVPYSDSTEDYIKESFFNEQASKNAWDRSVFAAKNQYQWLVDDLRKAGLNPMMALSGLNAASATSSGSGVTGGLGTSRSNTKATNETNILKALLTSLISIVGIAMIKK